MKVLLILIIGLAGAFILKPDFFASLPIPTNADWEQRQLDGYAKRCLKDVVLKVQYQIKDRMGLRDRQFQSLLDNPIFQKSYCECASEIVRYNKLVPSHFLPKTYRIQKLRGIASKMENHLRTSEGQSQAQYCFQNAWNKAAFSY